MMPKEKPSARLDFLALAQHDPSILTFRHCTGDDIRRLAPLVPMPRWRARRAFNLKLFTHPDYLTRSLDPAFEPQRHSRERAALILLGSNILKNKTLRPVTPAQPARQAPPPPRSPLKTKPVGKPSKLARYSFD